MGERVGLIGALSVETAAKYLNARDVDGIVIGEGFNPRTVEAFLTVLGEDGKPVRVDPTITLAVLKATDTVESLLARVSEPVAVAAQ